MRVVVRSAESGHRWFVFVGDAAAAAELAPAKARVFNDERIDQLRRDRAIVERRGPQLLRCGARGDVSVLFVRCDAHGLLGGSRDGFLKMVKARFHVDFLHFSELVRASAFWEDQFAWLALQLGGGNERIVVSPREQQQQQQQQQQKRGRDSSSPSSTSPPAAPPLAVATKRTASLPALLSPGLAPVHFPATAPPSCGGGSGVILPPLRFLPRCGDDDDEDESTSSSSLLSPIPTKKQARPAAPTTWP